MFVDVTLSVSLCEIATPLPERYSLGTDSIVYPPGSIIKGSSPSALSQVSVMKIISECLSQISSFISAVLLQ